MITARRLTLPVSYHYDLYSFEDGAAKPLLLCLHGYGQDKATAMRFGQNIRRDWPIAALQAPHPHHRHSSRDARDAGFGWVSDFEPQEDITNHHRFILAVIDKALELGLTDRPAAFLFGFSQSVSLNYRFAAAHPERVSGVIAVAGAAPSDWEDADSVPKLTMPVLHIAPTEDEVYAPDKTARFQKVLEARATQLTWLDMPGGHRVPRAAYPVIRHWLDEYR